MKKLFVFSVMILVLACQNEKGNRNEDEQTEKSIESLISQMTLEEKITMIHAKSSFISGGCERLGIPGLIMSDGPHGVRHEHGLDWIIDADTNDYVTYLPTGIALASTWNKDLGYQFGSVLGSEANARGKHVILGPAINIIRTPLGGRNFEYLSEDPCLAAQMATGYVKGVQDQDVIACPKHFVANNQETQRAAIDVIISERALREIYLPAFKAAVKEGNAYSIMGAYNKINGQYCTHNDYLVNKILKGEYEFSGFLVSDWGAVHDTKEALLNGCDIEMGTELLMKKADYSKFYLADSALAMVKRGEVDEKNVDDKVRRILRSMYNINVFGKRKEGEVNTPEHQQLALKVAEESMVLLKNEKILPLDTNNIKRIVVIGHNAIRKHAEEGGSSQVKALYEITPLEGIKNFAGESIDIEFAEGYKPNEDNVLDIKLAKEAVNMAKNADAVIFVGGWIHNMDPGNIWACKSYDMEGTDKENLRLLFGQEKLINEIASVNPNLAVIIMGGSNVEMISWMDNAKAIIQAWYPGMEGGNAIANVIFGETNPSGKLPMTFANSYMDYPSHKIGEFPGKNLQVHYTEDVFTGYRYFVTEDVEPLFPFGFGLSYTTFDYSTLKVERNKDLIEVSCTVTNTGDLDGAEVVQLYIHQKDAKIKRPFRELKEFEKIGLKAGESKKVSMQLTLDDFKYFDEEIMDWKLDPGTYEIQCGSSSRDILLRKSIDL